MVAYLQEADDGAAPRVVSQDPVVSRVGAEVSLLHLFARKGGLIRQGGTFSSFRDFLETMLVAEHDSIRFMMRTFFFLFTHERAGSQSAEPNPREGGGHVAHVT